MSILSNGKYEAMAAAGSVYENAKGSLVAAFRIDEIVGYDLQGAHLTARQTLATEKDGINTRGTDAMKTIFGWDGQDPFWLAESTNIAGKRFEIVVENEPDQSGKVWSNVKWMNPLGGGQAAELPKSGDRAALLAKYGARFRALAGGTPAATIPKKAEAPAAAPARPASPAPKPPAKAPAKKACIPSTQEACWQKHCELAGEKAEGADVEQSWYALLEELVPGKRQDEFAGEDWGRVMAKLDNLPF